MFKKIGVTGGAGFIGSHLVDYFVEQGENIKVIDDFSKGRMRYLEKSKDSIEITRADLTKEEETFRALKDCDIVIHLGAKIGGVGYLNNRPAEIISDNDMMNRNVFEAGRRFGFDRLVYASSSMLFENTDKFPIREEHLDQIPPPTTEYGFQKLNGEYYCRSYKQQYGLDYSIFRPFNVTGTREPPEDEVGQAHVIPDLVKKIVSEKQQPVKLLGDGEQIRSFTNVRDLVKGVYRCTFMDEALNEDFNLGSEEDIKMKELAELIWEISGRSGEIEFEFGEPFEKDQQKRVPTYEKSEEVLGWKPEIPLRESVKEYLEWYKKEVVPAEKSI